MKHILLKQALAKVSFSPYPIFSLVLFFVFFTLCALWILRPGARKKYDNIAQEALKD